LIVVIERAYTPTEFATKRFNVFLKRKAGGRLRKQIYVGIRPGHADEYGYVGINAARAEAQEWATLLQCEVTEDEKAEEVLCMQSEKHGNGGNISEAIGVEMETH
jgi:hypothetical protein